MFLGRVVFERWCIGLHVVLMILLRYLLVLVQWWLYSALPCRREIVCLVEVGWALLYDCRCLIALIVACVY